MTILSNSVDLLRQLCTAELKPLNLAVVAVAELFLKDASFLVEPGLSDLGRARRRVLEFLDFLLQLLVGGVCRRFLLLLPRQFHLVFECCGAATPVGRRPTPSHTRPSVLSFSRHDAPCATCGMGNGRYFAVLGVRGIGGSSHPEYQA